MSREINPAPNQAYVDLRYCHSFDKEMPKSDANRKKIDEIQLVHNKVDPTQKKEWTDIFLSLGLKTFGETKKERGIKSTAIENEVFIDLSEAATKQLILKLIESVSSLSTFTAHEKSIIISKLKGK